MHSNEQKPEDFPRCHRRWKIPFFIAGIILIKSGLVMFLWNALIPDLFQGPVLTYLQAIELTILAKILTGFRPGHGFRGHHHWREHWLHMTPEQREKFREEMKNRCGR